MVWSFVYRGFWCTWRARRGSIWCRKVFFVGDKLSWAGLYYIYIYIYIFLIFIYIYYIYIQIYGPKVAIASWVYFVSAFSRELWVVRHFIIWWGPFFFGARPSSIFWAMVNVNGVSGPSVDYLIFNRLSFFSGPRFLFLLVLMLDFNAYIFVGPNFRNLVDFW